MNTDSTEGSTLKYQYKEPYSLSIVGRKYITDKDISEIEEVMNDETIDVKFDERAHLLASKVIVVNYQLNPSRAIRCQPQSRHIAVFKPYPPSPYINLSDPDSIYYGGNYKSITNAVATLEIDIQLDTKEAIWDPLSKVEVLIPFLDSDDTPHPTTKAKLMEIPYEDRLELISSSGNLDKFLHYLNHVDAKDLLDPPEAKSEPLCVYLVERNDADWEDVEVTVVTAYTEAQAEWLSKYHGMGGAIEVTRLGIADPELMPRELILSNYK